MTIRSEEYGRGGPPALTAKELNLDVGDVVVLTIAGVEPDVKIPQPGGDEPRKVLVLKFEEYPDFAYYTNKTGVDRLVAGLGDEEKKWIDKKIPLYCTEQPNPTTGKVSKVLWVADPALWEKHMKGSKRAASRKRR